jgi:hypothetical protein
MTDRERDEAQSAFPDTDEQLSDWDADGGDEDEDADEDDAEETRDRG